jgi:hypothetical protein
LNARDIVLYILSVTRATTSFLRLSLS